MAAILAGIMAGARALASLKEILTLLSSIWDGIKAAAKFVHEFFVRREQTKIISAMDKAEEKISKANGTDDEQKRLRKKAEAACEIEKAINPDSTCS